MPIRSALLAVVLVLPALLAAQGQGRGAGMGRMGAAQDGNFLDSSACALCHAAAPTAQALWSATGDDVSPYATWRGTMMANSFRDPYWRAQVAKEVSAAPPGQRAAIEGLCLRCHGPMAHHEARLAKEPAPGIAAAAQGRLAQDGVSCTVCHQVHAEKLGTSESFSGNLDIRPERRIYGPYPDPAFQPMRMHTGFLATHGPHVQRAALCGSCHTLFTTHVPGGKPFPEQTPYLEWRNSVFSDEGGAGPGTRTCQECHMPDQGALRIARNPRGLDFNIKTRPQVRAHTFVGGNAWMLDLLRANREVLGVTAPAEALERNARATRRQLAHDTATVAIEAVTREPGRLRFAVRVTNLTGHKFPTGYPARRAWLRVQVRAGNRSLFVSGAADEQGRIAGVADERTLPHRDVIESAAQVQVYECVPADAGGRPTTFLTHMAAMGKDNRLLPRGWRGDAADAAAILPVGVEGDADFRGGEDVVRYAVPLPEDQGGSLTVVATLLYQSVPPAWVEPLRAVDAEEARTFVRLYDASGKTPETVAVTVAIVE